MESKMLLALLIAAAGVVQPAYADNWGPFTGVETLPEFVSDARQDSKRIVGSTRQRLKRVFGIDIETCAACGGALRIIACIKDPAVIKKILTNYLGVKPPSGSIGNPLEEIVGD